MSCGQSIGVGWRGGRGCRGRILSVRVSLLFAGESSSLRLEGGQEVGEGGWRGGEVESGVLNVTCFGVCYCDITNPAWCCSWVLLVGNNVIKVI